MAKLYNTKDLDQEQLDAEKARAKFWNPFGIIAFIGMACEVVAPFILDADYSETMKCFAFGGACFVAFMFCGIMGSRGQKTTSKSTHRSKGHDAFVKKIGEVFSDEYHAVFSVFLKKENKNNQIINCLLIGPTGVFIIDFSTATGAIEAKKDLSLWPHKKVGSRGTPYEGADIKNPIKRLNYKSTLLRTLLKQQDFDLWVEGYFIFTQCTQLITDAPNIYSDYFELKEQITNKKTVLNKQQISKIVKLVVGE